jgi:putative nucleotidyltransferase with HDIG domain
MSSNWIGGIVKDGNRFSSKKKFHKRKGEVHFRRRYIDPSRRFLEWVNSFGFEHTILGKWFTVLDRRLGLRRTAFLFLFCLCLSLLMFYNFDFPYNVNVSEVAKQDIRSPISFQFVDEMATEEKRNEAERSVKAVFDYDADLYEGIFSRVYRSFREMRKLSRAVKWPRGRSQKEEAIKKFLKNKPAFEKSLGASVSDRSFEWLVEKNFSASVENIVIRALVKWSNMQVVDNIDSVLRADEEQVILRELMRDGAAGDDSIVDRSSLRDMRNVRSFSLENVAGSATLNSRDRNHVLKLARDLLVPNVSFNRQETSLRRRKARKSVLPVQISIQKNQTIVAAGSEVKPVHITILEEIQNLKSDRRVDFISMISAILFVLLILVFFSYLRRFTEYRVRVEVKDLYVMGFVAIVGIAIVKTFLFVLDATLVARFPALPVSSLLYAAPIAAAPMMVGLLITSGEVVWIFTMFISICAAIMMNMNFPFLVVASIGGIAGARGVYGCKKRNDIYWAGIRTGLVTALAAVCVTIIGQIGSGDVIDSTLWVIPSGFIGGILSAMVAMTLIPLLESMFNYTTDIKLLELSNLNHPLMKEMIVRAPGTYHHSMAVGYMVEGAAEKIGANALLAKVMAYYHDIGKMEHAQYFIENQRPGFNPHDQISPYMSKTILIAHVKDGAELGLSHKLGKPIIDAILQHHGTTLISYFYNKALAERDDAIDHVEESEFRYPGPKPQFKESGLVMLADSIEAAARSLEEPTSARLSTLVRNIIHNKFADGQLDECNLTLKELSIIEESFKKSLLSVYHQRIDYPHMKLGKVVPTQKPAKKKGSSTA